MKLKWKIIFNNVSNFVKEGKYSEAYEYVKTNECIEKEHLDDLNCFRYLLSCILGGVIETPQFSWLINDSINQTPMMQTESIIKQCCKDSLFKDLINLCNKCKS